MLVLHPIGMGQAGYYQHEAGYGHWLGGGSASLHLAERVDTDAFRDVLAGRRPGGDVLLGRLLSHRRAGFDLIFAAPKSVSLLERLAPPAVAPALRAAHSQAVDAAVGYLERQATWTRRGRAHERIATTGLVAAAFGHGWSAAGDPHLHTHVVLANLVLGEDGKWSCLDSRALYRHAGAAGAIFQASLRYDLAQRGLGFMWQVRPSGVADIAGLPRAAIEACSLRRRQVVADLGEGWAGSRQRDTAAGRTRRLEAPGAVAPWHVRAAEAGLDQAVATNLVVAAMGRTIPAPVAPPANTTERALVEQRSQFERRDVVRVMAGLSPQGARPDVVERWATDYLGGALRVGPAVWTTPGMRRLEDRIAGLARAGSARTSIALAQTDQVEAVLTKRPELGPAGWDAVRRLTLGGTGVELVRPADFVTQAWILDAARAAWEASGHRVAVLSRDQRGAARWQALSGIGPPQRPPARATVLVVDGADRRSTADLHQVLSESGARNAKVVLIDGGTVPARRTPESPAMAALRTTLPGVDPVLLAPPEIGPVVRAGRDATVTIARDGPAAAAQLLADWHQARAGGRPTMVALGPEEAEYLNVAARAVLNRTGELSGPAITAGGRQFQTGDEVRALRRDARLGGAAAGTVGVVTGVDAQQHCVTIRWPDQEVDIAGAKLARAPLAHAYATTPRYARGANPGEWLCLGDPSSIRPGWTPHTIVGVAGIGVAGIGVAGPPPTPVRHQPLVPADASRSLAELVQERDQLASRLKPSLPADPGPELRLVDEERALLLGRASLPPWAGNRLTELQTRRSELVAASAAGLDWLEAHRGDLARWAELDAAVSWREHALGRAAEIRPSRAVEAQLGPQPAGDGEDRRAWRQAAGAIEAYRERWALPDRPLDVAGREHPSQRQDQRRVLDSCRALAQSQSRDHAISLPGL